MKTKKHALHLRLPHGSVWRRIIIFALLCAVLAALAKSDTLHAALLVLIEACQELIARHPAAGAALFVAVAAVSAMFAFVSVAVLVPVAVYAWGQPLSLVLLWGGWLLGGILAYSVGRHLGRPIVQWLTADRGLPVLERHLRRETPLALVLLFQLALPSEIPGYVLGLVKYSFARYCLSLSVAELPYALLTVYLGASFLERRGGVVLGVGLLLTLLSIAAFIMLRRQLSAQENTKQP